MDDIVDRLRRAESLTRGPLYSLAVDALDEIETLRKANAAQRDQIVALNERLHSKTIIVKADLHGDAAQIKRAVQQMEGGQ